MSEWGVNKVSLLDRTVREIRSEYLDNICGIAKDAVEMLDERDVYIRGAVDLSIWTTDPLRATMVTILSPNSLAWETCGSGDQADYTPEVKAFFAMRADVEEEVLRIIDER